MNLPNFLIIINKLECGKVECRDTISDTSWKSELDRV